MRNLVRWRNKKETGTFSGKPKPSSGYKIQLLKGSRMIYIDAVYQADERQFCGWFKHMTGVEVIISEGHGKLTPEERIVMLEKHPEVLDKS